MSGVDDRGHPREYYERDGKDHCGRCAHFKRTATDDARWWDDNGKCGKRDLDANSVRSYCRSEFRPAYVATPVEVDERLLDVLEKMRKDGDK